MTGRAGVATLVVVVACLAAGCTVGPAGGGDPGWVEADGETVNATALTVSHVEALSEAGSYVVEREALVFLPPGGPDPDRLRPNQSVRREVDLEARQRTAVREGPEDRTTRVYVDDDRYYARVVTSRETTYRTREANWRRIPPTDPSTVTPLFGDWNLTYKGTAERDGERLHRVTGEPPADYEGADLEAVDAASVELLVTDEGIVRRIEHRATGTVGASRSGETETVEVTYVTRRRYGAVGETTVEEPDWVEDARASR